MKASTKTDLLCFHCGDICQNNRIRLEAKHFCCDGCLTVHQILDQNGLSDYYSLEQFPGIKKGKVPKKRFEFLDEAEIASRLFEFEDEQHGKYTFKLPEIHCSSCVWLLENLDRLHKGVTQSRVRFLKKEATIIFKKELISFRELAELLDEIGYTPDLSLQDLEKPRTGTNRNSLIKKLAVAGFCFGNVMLFSFPEYFGLQQGLDGSFTQIFGGLNLAFGTLALAYSGEYYIRSAYKSLRKRLVHINVPLAIGMITLFAQTVFEILSGSGAGYADSLTGLIFFLLIGKWFQDRTYESMNFERDYKSYFPIAVRVIRDKTVHSKPLSEIEKGDRIQIRNEELIPVDGILLHGHAAIDYSFVTGESVPVNKELGELLYAGGKQLGSSIELEATRSVSQSQLTRIWNELGEEKEQTQTKAFSDRIARYFTITLIGIALLTLAWWLWADPGKAIFAFTSVLIVACPCALALSSPFALGNAMRILGRKKFYLKNASVVEELSNIDHIVFDKTGTLTRTDRHMVQYTGDKLSNAEKEAVKGIVSHSKHPYSEAIYAYLSQNSSATVDHFKEYSGKGIEAFVGEKYYQLGSARWLGAEDNTETSVCLFINGEEYGQFRIQNYFQPDLHEVFEGLAAQKMELSILSGDQATEKSRLLQFFDGFKYMLFRQTPQDKLEAIQKMQEIEQEIMMVGDGLNDAGALLQSDVGAVITHDSNNFTPAAKMIIDQQNVGLLPGVMAYAKKVMQLIRFSFLLSLIYNLTGLYFAVQGLLSPVIAAILMPLSSITVVVFNTLSTQWAAKGLVPKTNEVVPE